MALHPLLGLGLFSPSRFYTQSVELLGRGISLSQGLYLHTEQHKHRTNAHTDIHALSGIRTHNPSFRVSEDSSCLRPYGHCDRRSCCTDPRILDLDTTWTWIGISKKIVTLLHWASSHNFARPPCYFRSQEITKHGLKAESNDMMPIRSLMKIDVLAQKYKFSVGARTRKHDRLISLFFIFKKGK
jgi:hypothetical protein